MNDAIDNAKIPEEPPPLLRTWNRLYAAVILYTCILIAALYFMTILLNR